MPAVRSTRAHDVKVEDGGVWVRLRAEAGAGGPPLHGTIATPAVAAPPATPATPTAAGPAAAAGSAAAVAAGEAGPLCEDRVREILKEVKDPELFVNIVDLGLIYGVTLSPSADVPGKQHVAIDMTMTSPACPAGPQLIADTKRCVGASPEVAAVEVRIVMEPPWTPDRMTDAARDQLGIF
ncbi:MAG: metal-sulfur cluster assembly factor [Planctomycetia bacterium]|nr:metal-sulfur cluster assembly factor [Planctomycetia bacterium]